jgi:hypothetical protein
LVLGVAVFQAGEPVVRESVVETCSDCPTNPCAVATDRDAGKRDRGLVRDERGASGQIEQGVISSVAEAPADRAAPFAARREEISGDAV